jgi:uncharacterized repeat protein (TIGR01451 family)
MRIGGIGIGNVRIGGMTISEWITRATTIAALAGAAVVAGCGDGSGRQGTDVQVTAGSIPGQVTGGDEVVYTMTVANVGSNTAADVTVTAFGGNVTGCAAFGGATCPSVLGAAMAVGSMPSGSRLEFELTLSVPRGSNGSIANTLSASFGDDTERANNSATVTTVAASELSDVVLELTSSSASATGGGSAEFVYTLRNDGPDAATGVSVINDVGSNLALTGITCTSAGGAACPASLSPVMEVPSLPPGGSLVFTVTTQVVLSINGTVTNTMAVSADSDSDRSNNSAVGSTAVVTPVTGLSLTGIGPTGVAAGTSATFRMTLVNTGPDPAANVRVIDRPGGNVTLTGIVCTASGGAVCPAVLGPQMDVTNLPAGGALVFDVTARVANGTNGTIINEMSAATTSGPRQEVVAVGTGSAYSNNLRVDATAPASQVTSGNTADWTVEVRNDGPASAFNATLTITYGTGLSESAVTCIASGGAVCPATGSTMTVSEIPASGVLTFTVQALVAAGTNALVSLTAQSSVLGDAIPSDNADTAGVRAAP